MENNNLAIPFIKFTEEDGFQVTDEAVEFLQSLECKKLGIVSIVGKYRTGKSYFVNKVLLQSERNKGFKVGPTINPCTKGIWIWKKVINITTENDENLDVIIMDTEGFGGIDEDANHDTRIFLFSILLSSFFIYNSLGAINENALNSLALIVNLAKDIKIKKDGSQSEEDVKKNFPSFLWVIRDFMLSLETQTGKKLTSRQYLEKALEEQRGISQQIQGKNKIRKMIKYFFQERDCMTFVRPVETENDLKRLETLDKSYLRPEFVNQMEKARQKIFKKLQPKKIGDTFANGNVLIEIAKAYVAAVNGGKVPNIESAWTYVCKESVQKAIRQCVKKSAQIIDEISKDISIFDDEIQFQQNILQKIEKIYQGLVIGENIEKKTGLQKVQEEVKKKIKDYKELETSSMKKNIEKQFDDQYFKIKERIISEQIPSIQQAKKELQQLQDNLMQGKQNIQKQKIIEKLILQKENEILNMFITIQKKQDEQKREQEKELKRQMEMLNKEQENINYKYKKAEEELDEIKQKLTKAKEKKKELQLQNQELQIQLQQKNYEYDQIKKEFDDYKNNVIKRNEKQHDKEISKLEKQNDQMNNKLLNYEKEIQQLKQQNDLQLKQLQHQEKLNNDMSFKIKEMNQNQQKQQFEFEQIRNISPVEVSNMKQQINQYEKQLFEYRIKQTTLEDQIQIEKNKTDEIKILYDKFLSSFSTNNIEKEQPNSDLLETNKNLSNMLNKSHQKIKNLEEQVDYFKKFKKIIKNSKSIQCGYCFEEILSSEFMIHLDHCKQSSINDTQTSYITQQRNQFSSTDYKQQQYQRMQNNITPPILKQQQIYVKIERTTINAYNSRQMDYVIEVYDINEQKWIVNKRYKEFCNLYVNLQKQFPLMIMPKSSSIVTTFYQNIDQMIKKRFLIDERKKALENFVNDLLKVQQIFESDILKNFLEIDKNHPQKEEDIPKKEYISQVSLQKQNKSNKKLKQKRNSEYKYKEDENDLIYNLNQIKANSKLLSSKKYYQNNQLFNQCIKGIDSILDNKDIESIESDEIVQQEEEQQQENEEQGSVLEQEEENDEEEGNDEDGFIMSYYNPDIEEIPEVLSEDYIVKNYTDYHNHLKSCIDGHFTRDPVFQIPMNDIVADCIGEHGIYLTKYYNDILFLTKKFFMDNIKENLIKYGKGVFLEGVEYFKAIQLFTELGYNIRETIKVNLDKLLEVVSVDKGQIFKTITSDAIVQYETLLEDISNQKELFLHYIKVKRFQYDQDYPVKEEDEEVKEEEEQKNEEESEEEEEENQEKEEGKEENQGGEQ